MAFTRPCIDGVDQNVGIESEPHDLAVVKFVAVKCLTAQGEASFEHRYKPTPSSSLPLAQRRSLVTRQLRDRFTSPRDDDLLAPRSTTENV